MYKDVYGKVIEGYAQPHILKPFSKPPGFDFKLKVCYG